MTNSVKQNNFQLKGWHVLMMLFVFFGSITAVNAVMITLAIKTFPGEQERKSYMQGLHYNDHLMEKQQQETLGWKAVLVDSSTLPASNTNFRIQILDKNNNAVTNLAAIGSLNRPTTDVYMRNITLTETLPGLYEVEENGLLSGIWILQVQFTSSTGERFNVENRLALESY